MDLPALPGRETLGWGTGVGGAGDRQPCPSVRMLCISQRKCYFSSSVPFISCRRGPPASSLTVACCAIVLTKMKQVGYRKTCLFDIENLDQNRPQKSAQISNLTGRPCGSCILLTVPPCHRPALNAHSTQFMDSWGWCILIRWKKFLLCFTFVCQVGICSLCSCMEKKFLFSESGSFE